MKEARRRGEGRRFAVVGFLALAWLCFSSTAAAATLHPIGSFKRPIFVTSDPSDHERLLVVEREGRVIEATPGATRTYADISALVACCESERGLLSIAPAPDFHSSGRFYAAYTGKPAAGGLEGDVHVDSFRPDPQVAGQLIREPILSVAHSQEPNHNGGQLQFGPDGHLYISLGDGGGGGDPFENGQDLEQLLAKILRIDPRPGESPAYAIPAGNPFAAGAGRDEIWAYGLRNPWRFSFDYLSGDMVIADVGQDAREEVDFAPAVGGAVSGAGANYGWSCREGFIAYTSPAANCAGISNFVDPVFDYPHEDPGGGVAHGCSIIGGYVVRDQSVSDLYGRYVYGDYCAGELRSLLLPSTSSGLATDDRDTGLHVSKTTSFGEDSCGRVYVMSSEGAVYRIEGGTPAVCPQPSLTPISKQASRKPRLHLSARWHGLRLRILASVVPCATHRGERLRLNRGGKRFAVKRLGRNCVARFHAHVGAPATFRALLPGTGLRSRRLRVEPRRVG